MQGCLPNTVRAKRAAIYGRAFAALCVISLAAPAQADDSRPSWRDVWKWRESWSGVDIAKDNWLLYSGVTVAPFGHIHESGWRMRFAGGYGQYKYQGNRATGPTPQIQSFAAATHYGDALIGYLERWGPLTAKAFAGISYLAHDIAPLDPDNLVTGDDIGFKGALELWLDIGDMGFASLDASWNTAHNTRNVRSRLGARVAPNWSSGLEAWLNLDDQSDCDLGWNDTAACYGDEKTELLDYTRAGLFLRYDWDGGELSLSSGVSGGSFGSSGNASPEPYATLNWLTQF